MNHRLLWTLMAKDLRLHGRQLLLVVAGASLLIGAAIRYVPNGGPIDGLVFNINVFLPMVLGEWLIARERSTRTLAWLRSLPVDDRTLAMSKFSLAAVASVALWTVTSGLFARELWRPPGTALPLQLCLLAFGAICIATRWRINWHLAHAVPFASLAVLVLLFMVLVGEDTERAAAVIAFWNAPYGRPLVSAGLAGLYLAIVWSTVRWVERADTYELLD